MGVSLRARVGVVPVGKFSIGQYFAEIHTLADLQFMRYPDTFKRHRIQADPEANFAPLEERESS